jgi:hypothetical protein
VTLINPRPVLRSLPLLIRLYIASWIDAFVLISVNPNVSDASALVALAPGLSTGRRSVGSGAVRLPHPVNSFLSFMATPIGEVGTIGALRRTRFHMF